MAPLLCFYLLLCLWAYLLPFLAMLAYWTLFIYLFISSLGSQGPFALLLPLIVPVGLLATISCHAAPLDLISFFFSSLGFYGHLLLFCFSILFFFIFAYYWAFLLLGPFFIYQKRVSTTIKSKYFKLRVFLLLFLT